MYPILLLEKQSFKVDHRPQVEVGDLTSCIVKGSGAKTPQQIFVTSWKKI